MAFAIYFHIRNRESNRTLEIFDEKLHPLSVSQHAIIYLVGGGGGSVKKTWTVLYMCLLLELFFIMIFTLFKLQQMKKMLPLILFIK